MRYLEGLQIRSRLSEVGAWRSEIEGLVVSYQIVCFNVEVDRDQHTLKRRIMLFNRFGCLVEFRTDVVFKVFQVRPSRPFRDNKGIIFSFNAS